MKDIIETIYESFDIDDIRVNGLSPLVLAYIGDSVYDTVIRTVIVSNGNMQVNKMNQRAKQYVSAKGQAKIFRMIEDDLSESEMAVYKRGRNAKSNTRSKNASLIDYRVATGFEALLGYLYLTKNYGRMIELIKKGLADG